MRKMKNFNYLTGILGILLMIFTVSCKEEDPPVDNTPVLGTNFNYTVDENVVTFTTTLVGNVWWSSGGTDYPAVNQEAVVPFAEKGTYSFTCNLLEEGVTLTSDPFDVEVTVGDVSIYDTEYWINLTGGYGMSKTWVLDVEGKIHPGPLSFMGTSWDFVAGENVGDDAWMWDPGWDWIFVEDSANVRMDWPGDDGYGSMTFDLIDGKNFTADKKKEPAESGTYTLTWDTRTISITGATILHDYKPFAQVKDDPNCSEDCPTHVVDGKTGISDWNNYKIYALTDSVVRLAVSRDQDVHSEGVCWLIYNFVETDIYESIIIEQPVEVEWPDKLTAVETNDAVESAKLEGTWAPVGTHEFAAWFPGFWNFTTGTNDYPTEYGDIDDVTWDPYYPGEGDTWAIPSDSIKALTMTFGADLSFVVKHNDTEVGNGTYMADGTKVTVDGTDLISPDDRIFDHKTALVTSVDGTMLKLGFYQAGSDVKNEWVQYNYTKQ